jgi:IrrE N-terminal-like domain
MAIVDPPTYDVKQIEQLARGVLSNQFGTDIVIPVDVDLLVEQLPGVDLDYWPALSANYGLEGMVARDRETHDLFVFIDDRLADSRPTRYRMTVAEELGHLTLHRSLIEAINEPNDFRELQQHPKWGTIERNAKRFAAAILMPGDVLVKQAEQLYPKLVEVAGYGDASAILAHLASMLAKQFAVSPQSMNYRLDEWPMKIKTRVVESIRDRIGYLG